MQVNSNLTPLNNYNTATNKLEKLNSPTNNSVVQSNKNNSSNNVTNFSAAASKVVVDTYPPTHTSRDKQGVSLYQQVERERISAEEGELVSRFHVEA